MTDSDTNKHLDIGVIGAGAAGLFASIWAGRESQKLGIEPRVCAFDGAKKLGAKVLVAGGGRCNVTHHEVKETAYAGSSRNAIKQVLRAWDVKKTTNFFRDLGVELKREDTGKLFPTTDRASTVLDALLGAARDAGARLIHPNRVLAVEKVDGLFAITTESGIYTASVLVLATGGKALPRTGSDGAGYDFARTLGHSITGKVFPALVPLCLPTEHFIRDLSGITLPTTIELRAGTGRKLASYTNSTLCTHFGLSGPSVLDISRYFTDERTRDPEAGLFLSWLPGASRAELDQQLQSLGKSGVGRWLAGHLPARLAETLCHVSGVQPSTTGASLRKDQRRALLDTVLETPLPITGDRGWTHAEVTAGGVPLSEINVKTMESRVCTNLFLCGEICDVDGRIGGFNFQWAWASGHVAGTASARALSQTGRTGAAPGA